MTPPCPARLTVLVCGTLLVACGCTPPDAGRPDRTSAQYLQIIALEDARPTGGDDLAALIVDGVESMIMIDQESLHPIPRSMTRCPNLLGIHSSKRFGEIWILDGLAMIKSLDARVPDSYTAA